MPYYNNSFKTLEDLEKDYYQHKAPKVFSFAGILARICQPSECPEDNSLEHEFECHLGTKLTLVVTYEVPILNWTERNPDLIGYHFDPRTFLPPRNEVTTCLVFIPRLELIYIENDKLYCTFLGGSGLQGRMMIDGEKVAIGPNRVVLRVDASSFALEKFILQKRPLNILGDSIIHPATIGKLPGQKWPLNEADRTHLLQVLPALVRTHHAVAFMNSQTHEVNDDLGLRIMNEIEDLRNYDGADAELEKEYRESAEGMQPISITWLKSFKWMVYNLRTRRKVDTTVLRCKYCDFKKF